MKKTSAVVLLAAVFLLGTYGTVFAAKKIVRIHSQMPVGHYMTNAVELFMKEATARSDNTLVFKHYPAQQLYKDKDAVEAIPEGLVEMGMGMNISSWSGKMSEVNLGVLSSVWKDYDHYVHYLYDYENGGGFNNHLYKLAKEKLNVVCLGSYPYARNHATIANTPIKTLDDWKGKKLRVGTKSNAVFLEAMGASTIFMSSSEVYMAMQRGVIEGAQSGFTSFVSRKWFEVAKYVTDLPCMLPEAFYTFVNLDFWNSLDKKQRKAIIDAWVIAAKFDEKAAYEDEFKARETLAKNGVEIYEVPKADELKWKERATPAIRKNLILPAVNGDQQEADKIWAMIEKTRTLPESTDTPAKFEVPMQMYDMWYDWLIKEEGLE